MRAELLKYFDDSIPLERQKHRKHREWECLIQISLVDQVSPITLLSFLIDLDVLY